MRAAGACFLPGLIGEGVLIRAAASTQRFETFLLIALRFT
jgi:hypothetical protein